MEDFKKLMDYNLSPSTDWDNLSILYNNFINNKTEESLIPKKIHQIWLGTMPEPQKRLIPKIIDNHKGWEYKLWSFEDLENYPMRNKDLFNSVKNLGAKSDIARYEILYNEGGIYLDSDFEMVTNFESLINNEFFTGVGRVPTPEVFNGLIGCTKNNELMGLVLDGLKDKPSDGNVMSLTGPYHFASIFFNYIKNNMDKKIVALPTPYFYPLPSTQRFMIRNNELRYKDYIHSFNTDKTICIHLWYNSWQ